MVRFCYFWLEISSAVMLLTFEVTAKNPDLEAGVGLCHHLLLTQDTNWMDGRLRTDASISPLSKNSHTFPLVDSRLKRLTPKTEAKVSGLLTPSYLFSVAIPRAAPHNTDSFPSQHNLPALTTPPLSPPSSLYLFSHMHSPFVPFYSFVIGQCTSAFHASPPSVLFTVLHSCTSPGIRLSHSPFPNLPQSVPPKVWVF